MLEYNILNYDENDGIIISITSEKYMGAIFKIIDLQLDEQNNFTFSLELAKKNESLFKDNDFLNEVQLIVGDIVKRSVNNIWGEAENIVKKNIILTDRLKDYGIDISLDTTPIEFFMKHGLLLDYDEENDKVIIIKISNGNKIDIDNADELFKIKELF